MNRKRSLPVGVAKIVRNENAPVRGRAHMKPIIHKWQLRSFNVVRADVFCLCIIPRMLKTMCARKIAGSREHKTNVWTTCSKLRHNKSINVDTLKRYRITQTTTLHPLIRQPKLGLIVNHPAVEILNRLGRRFRLHRRIRPVPKN